MNRTVHRIAWIAWMILLALLLPVLATAQECATMPGAGSEIRFEAGRRTITGEILELGADSVRLSHSGHVQTLDRAETLAGAEIRCKLTESRNPNFLKLIAVGAGVGLVGGLGIGEATRGPAPPPEQRQFCFIFACSTYTYNPPRPRPAFGAPEGAAAGAIIGLLYGLFQDYSQGWVPLGDPGAGTAISPVVAPTPAQPGAWSLGLRVPVAGGI